MRRKIAAYVISLMVIAFGTSEGVRAGMIGLPLNLKNQYERIKFEGPVLPPTAHVNFCLRYPSDCKTPKIVFRGGGIKLTPERYADLIRVNAEVNRSIIPTPNERGVIAEEWVVRPSHGDCNDYAVTKRHELRGRGCRNALCCSPR